MKLFVLIGLLALTQTALAGVASPCKDADYMQLKIGDKAELQREFCFAKIHAESETRMHQIMEDGITQKRAIPADTTRDEEASMDYLKSAGTCRVRAKEFEVALTKRFKSKPPKSCD